MVDRCAAPTRGADPCARSASPPSSTPSTARTAPSATPRSARRSSATTSLYTWDHFFPLYGAQDGAHFECWSLLAAWAEATERIELGPLVACNSYRNPHLLADIARTVDHVSDGRVILGIGAGWFRRDYEEYGYAFGTIGDRLTALEAAIPRIARPAGGARTRRRSAGMPLLIAGVARADAAPRRPPRRRPGTPRSPTGRRSSSRRSRRCADWCAVEGRDPADIEWSVGVEPDDLDRFFAEDAETYLAMGFSQFTLGFEGPAWRVDDGAAALAWRDRVNRDRVPDRCSRVVTDDGPSHARPRRACRGRHHRIGSCARSGPGRPRRRRPSCRASRSAPCCGRSSCVVADDDYLFVVVPAGRRFDWAAVRAAPGRPPADPAGRRRGARRDRLRALHDHARSAPAEPGRSSSTRR